MKDEERKCPECGGELFTAHYEPTAAYPETYQVQCIDCDYVGEPE